MFGAQKTMHFCAHLNILVGLSVNVKGFYKDCLNQLETAQLWSYAILYIRKAVQKNSASARLGLFILQEWYLSNTPIILTSFIIAHIPVNKKLFYFFLATICHSLPVLRNIRIPTAAPVLSSSTSRSCPLLPGTKSWWNSSAAAYEVHISWE